MQDAGALVIVIALVAASPFVADRLSRWIRLPSVVVEILSGILVGPAVLGWVHDRGALTAVSDFGLIMLMFLAGYEIDVDRVRGEPLRRASLGWAISLVVGLAAGTAVGIHRSALTGVALGLCLTTTALGTILPIVRDAGLLPTPFGAEVLAVGSVGEFLPIVAIALTLSGHHPGAVLAELAVFAVLACAALWLALRPQPRGVTRLVSATLHSSGQLAVRLSMLALVLLVWFASRLHLDNLLGAFTAGLVARLSLRGLPDRDTELISAKLDGLGFGLFVPVFFVMSGVRFDLRALFGSLGSVLLLPLTLVLFAVVRGVPTYLLARRTELAPRARELALFASTGLPLIVVITGIAVENDYMTPASAAALVGAGIVSVVVFPLLALGGTAPAPRPGAAEEAAAEARLPGLDEW